MSDFLFASFLPVRSNYSVPIFPMDIFRFEADCTGATRLGPESVAQIHQHRLFKQELIQYQMHQSGGKGT